MNNEELVNAAIERTIDSLNKAGIKYRKREFSEDKVKIYERSGFGITGVCCIIEFDDSLRSKRILKVRHILNNNFNVYISKYSLRFEYTKNELEFNLHFAKYDYSYFQKRPEYENAIFSSWCDNCICKTCLYYCSDRCPYGRCYDDKRAIDNPYDKAHPEEPPRKAWSNWMTDQMYWCRGGTHYKTYKCDNYLEYIRNKHIIKECLEAIVDIYQDGYIRCSLVDSLGCDECYKRFEQKIEKKFEKETPLEYN